MQFIKKNYEKIILGAVLLGLVAVLAFMPVLIMYDQQRMRAVETTYISTVFRPLPRLNLAPQEAVVKRLDSRYVLDFSTTNKLFNPVKWQRTAGGQLVKAAGLGPNAAVVTRIMPLYYSISLASVITGEPGGARYVFSIQDEAAPQPWLRNPRRRYASKGDTVVDKMVGGVDEGFTVLDVRGPTNNPTQLVLKLADSQATVSVAKDKSYRRVEAYTADLKYPPEKYTFNGLRVGRRIAFAGDQYNVIAIDKTNVILLAQSNQKKYNLPYAP